MVFRKKNYQNLSWHMFTYNAQKKIQNNPTKANKRQAMLSLQDEKIFMLG